RPTRDHADRTSTRRRAGAASGNSREALSDRVQWHTGDRSRIRTREQFKLVKLVVRKGVFGMSQRWIMRVWGTIGISVALCAANGLSLAAPTPAAPASEAKAPASQSAKLTERAWWNQPELIKGLQLKDEQRKKMDALFVKTFDAQRASQQAQGESQK